MGRKVEYRQFYLPIRLDPFLEELLKNPKIKMELIKRGLKYDKASVAKLAVYKLLEDTGSFETESKTHSKADK